MPQFSKLNRVRQSGTGRPIEALERRAYFSVDLTCAISVVNHGLGLVKPGQHITLEGESRRPSVYGHLRQRDQQRNV